MSSLQRYLFSTRRFVLFGLVVVFALCVATVWSHHAGAISNIAPDKNDYGNNDNARLTLTNTPSTKGVTELMIPVYVSAPSDATGISAKITLFSPYFEYGRSTTLGKVRAYLMGDSNVCMNGAADDMTVTVSGFTWSSKYELWYANVRVKLVNKKSGSDACSGAQTATKDNDALIQFKLRIDDYVYTSGGNGYTIASNGKVPASGGNSWLAYSKPESADSTSSTYFFATSHRAGSGNVVEDYSIPLATPCDVTGSDVKGIIELYDLDSGGADNGNLNMTVRVYDETLGGYVPNNINIIEYGYGGSTMGDNATYRIRMTFQPDHKYRLRVRNVHFFNILKYRFPYDNIAYVTSCPSTAMNPATVGPLLSIDPSPIVNDGAQYTVHFRTNSAATNDAQVSTTARVWYDANRNGTYDFGESSEFYEAGKTYMAPKNTTADVSAPSYTAAASRGNRICASWRLDASLTAGVGISTTEQVACIDIVPIITVRVLGNDLRTGSGYLTSGSNGTSLVKAIVTTLNAKLQGSWGEYGVVAPGSISGFASGSGIMSPSATDTQSTWSKLTFANGPSYGGYGTAAQLGTIPWVMGYDINKLAKGGDIVQSTGDITIDTLAGFSGVRVYKTTGNVIINGDISYADTAANEQALPQIIIIADNILINPDVTRVDAWLVAANTVDTCNGFSVTGAAATELTADRCNKSLTINGPIMAKSLVLDRTYSDADGNPAETVNMRSDAYLWSYRQAKGSSYRTSYISELPPRY